jgi:MFS family permease
MFGRRRLFIGAMFGFTFAALITGFAFNPVYMDVFSGILGTFSAAIVPPAAGQLGAVYEKPSKRKNRAFACFSAGNPLGFVGGMMVSGVATYVYSWRASFWTLAAIFSVFTVVASWTFPPDDFQAVPVDRNVFRKFDVLGTIFVVVGFACFSGAFS